MLPEIDFSKILGQMGKRDTNPLYFFYYATFRAEGFSPSLGSLLM